MEDLATLEISRAQTWQWLHHGAALEDGSTVDQALVRQVFDEELARILVELGDAPETRRDAFRAAAAEAAEIFCEPTFRPFLTTASELIADLGSDPASIPAEGS